MKRKLLTIFICCLVALTLAFSLVSCGDNNDNKEIQNTESTSGTENTDNTESTEGGEADKKSECELNGHTFANATCTSPKTCSVCGATDGEALGHTPNEDDGDCTTAILCRVCTEVTSAGKASHDSEADDGDCTTEVTCSECGVVTTEARKEHTGGTATCGAKAVCESCGTAYGELDLDNHVVIDGSCACGEIWHIDATEMTAEQLNAAVAEKLAAGETDIEIILAPDASVEMITAIRRAICDTEGVADGSINLTLKGVTTIPDHSSNAQDGSIVFGAIYQDKNGEYLDVQDIVLELNSINLPDVVTIGEYAFYCCENLVFVTAPKVQTIGEIAFAATALTSVEFPELTTIPNAIFNATYSLSSAKFPKVTTIESLGLLIGALFTPEAFLLELTAEGDITFNGESHFNVSSQNYSDKVDLVLHKNKEDQVTKNDDGTATWQVRDDLSYTFKSITFVGE